MKKLSILFAALMVSGAAFAQSTNTVGTSSSAQTSAVNTPVQSINSYGAGSIHTTGQAPSVGVGGSIGSHTCEAGVGGSAGWFGGSGGIAFSFDRQSCVFLNVGDFFQQSATMEDKSYQFYLTLYQDTVTRHLAALPAGKQGDFTSPEELELLARAKIHQDAADGLRQASYELMAEISPKVRGVLSRAGVLHGQAAVQSDQSGTVGLQPASTRIDE